MVNAMGQEGPKIEVVNIISHQEWESAVTFATEHSFFKWKNQLNPHCHLNLPSQLNSPLQLNLW